MLNDKPIICIDTGEIAKNYKAYLKTKHWKGIRLKYKGSKCLFCDSKRIQVHHLTYKNIGNETGRDLVPLCRKHHKKIHNIKKSGRRYRIKDSYVEFVENQWVIVKVYPTMFRKKKGSKKKR